MKSGLQQFTIIHESWLETHITVSRYILLLALYIITLGSFEAVVLSLPLPLIMPIGMWPVENNQKPLAGHLSFYI